jgi:hypothetical protein
MADSDTSIDLIPGGQLALGRAADAFLRALGGHKVTLRISDPAAGDTNSQLGITPPTTEDIVIAPAKVQEMQPPAAVAVDGNRRWQVMFSARALRAAAAPYGVTDLTAWLTGSQGIVWRGRLIPITSVICQSFADGEYMYLAIATE